MNRKTKNSLLLMMMALTCFLTMGQSNALYECHFKNIEHDRMSRVEKRKGASRDPRRVRTIDSRLVVYEQTVTLTRTLRFLDNSLVHNAQLIEVAEIQSIPYQKLEGFSTLARTRTDKRVYHGSIEKSSDHLHRYYFTLSGRDLLTLDMNGENSRVFIKSAEIRATCRKVSKRGTLPDLYR